MNIPITLSKYLSKQFLLYLAIVLLAISFIIILSDALETTRRIHGRDIPFRIIAQMVLLKYPFLLQQVLPFVILFAGILTFGHLTKNSELVVARAAGVSAWQFLLPAVSISFIAGILVITVINPLSAIMLSRFDSLEAKYFSGSSSTLFLSSSGLWLKQENKDDKEKAIIHALRASNVDAIFYDVTFFIFDSDNNFNKRIFTNEAILEEDSWLIKNGTISYANKGILSEKCNDYRYPTKLKIEQIQNSFSSPENISFWELPEFINTLKVAGFSAMRHILHWHKIMVTPFMLAAMVLFAAACSLRMPRRGGAGLLIAAGVIIGFGVKFCSDLVYATGMAGNIPLIFAAWSPAIISILVAAFLIFHLEDG